MSNKTRDRTDLKYAKWIKDGCGSGQGSEYKPWLTVRDVPSQGRSYRVYGNKTGRTHHLFSDFELAIFLLLEWNHETTDIREQFPLPIETTLALAEEAGIWHPAASGVEQYMTADFQVNAFDPTQPEFALQARRFKSANHQKLSRNAGFWQLRELCSSSSRRITSPRR